MKNKIIVATVLSCAIFQAFAQSPQNALNYTVTPIKVGNTAKTVFPPIEKINPELKEGVFIDVNRLLAVEKGMSKQETEQLIGLPHFQGNTYRDSEWNYLIKVATNPQKTEYTKCQAQTHFTKGDQLIDLLWDKPVCMALIQMKKPVETINLSSDFLFDFDKATLRPEAVNTLNQVANTVRGKPVRMTIQGFTDTYGTEQYNLGLSTQRANSVKNFLASQGINSPIDAVGMGEAEPAVNNCSPKVSAAGIACQAPNRRVVIHVTQ